VRVHADQLIAHAFGVLNYNWRGTHTIPAFGLYPHQWLWDSGFIALGLAHLSPERAAGELRRLHEAQWANGMLPHIALDPAVKTYWPDAAYWNTIALAAAAPKDLPTSGLTQPSVSPLALLKLVQTAGDGLRDAEGLLRELFPKLMRFHRWLLKARDPEDSGLITILHPWESGLDNSPAWDPAMERITPRDLPDYERRDTKHVDDPSERPSQKTYDRYVHLCEQLKRVNYDDEAAYATCDFLVKDPACSTLFYLSTQALRAIAERLGEDTGELDAWLERTRAGFDAYFYEPDDGLHYAYDLRAGERLRRRTVLAFLPLAVDFVDAPRAERLVDWLAVSNFCGDDHCDISAVPSTDVLSEDFSAPTYWRGPVWVNVNWLILGGLYRRGFCAQADACFEGLLALMWENGFWEFYRTDTGKGLGGRDFSWSAALAVDLVRSGDFPHPAKEAWRCGAPIRP
jgi:hypothetical protein